MKYPSIFVAVLAACVLSLPVPACGPGTCLAAGTLVSTPSGDIAIENLRVGDAVWSVDPHNGERVEAHVVNVRSGVRCCWRLTTASGRSVVATPDHPFYAPGQRRYMQLGTLAARADRSVMSYAKTLAADRVVDFRRVPGRRTVYDITLGGELHNFLADGILVHNKSEAAPRLPDYLTVQDVATSDTAVFMTEFLSGQGMGTPVMLTRDPFAGGVGIVHVMSTEVFDTLRIKIDLAGGYLELVLPASGMTVDLQVTLHRNTPLELTIIPVRAGVEGMPASIDVPRDG